MKKIVIIGATSAIAEQCARLWTHEHPAELLLLGRTTARLERVAADLKVRSPESTITAQLAEFTDPAAIQATADRIAGQRAVDVVLIAHGFLPDQTACESNLTACREALEINGISPALYAEAFAKHFARASRGTIVLISSVAGDRGRKTNYVYGAAKGLLNRYAQGLQHRFAGTDVKVILIKPGPTDTPMTAELKANGKRMASAESVARLIVKAADRGVATQYAPAKWSLIMFVVRHLPSKIFNKLNI